MVVELVWTLVRSLVADWVCLSVVLTAVEMDHTMEG